MMRGDATAPRWGQLSEARTLDCVNTPLFSTVDAGNSQVSYKAHRLHSGETMTRTPTSDRFAPGSRIGDYQVEREVAYEEASVVYLATHVVLPRKAYVKVTHPASRSAAVQLLREACILEALS